ncbi:hypothetical protein KZZ52_11660 [Dactylosporangium sp. AC04546]|uniref:hypothetical protein n=1 Tax=Dactylosporangium sp. AC04546 TaxID=2862460 RepID=UPI001EE11C95|nr:hypothetical protein [Dactylosporangium sp. AC04546]WVK86005.1 hypothetical protein KZZ52_11660 [Dactylosporangium sp. AC04546]
MTDVLARRYRALLRAYPRSYREQRGDELLGTLLDAAPPGRRRPAAREAVSLLREGFALRAGLGSLHTPAAFWRDGLHIGALLLLLATLTDAATPWLQPPIEPAPLARLVLPVLAVAAVLRGRLTGGLVLTLAWLVTELPMAALSWQAVTAAAALAVLVAGRSGTSRPRSPGWLLFVPLLMLITYLLSAGWPMHVALVVLVPLAALFGALVDPRLPVAAATLLASAALQSTLVIGPLGGGTVEYHASGPAVVFLALAIALLALGDRRARSAAVHG